MVHLQLTPLRRKIYLPKLSFFGGFHVSFWMCHCFFTFLLTSQKLDQSFVLTQSWRVDGVDLLKNT